MNKIKVTRSGFSFDILRTYSVNLNGERKRLSYQNNSLFLTESNEIDLQANIDWCSTTLYSKFDSKDNEIEFNIRTNPIFSTSGFIGNIFIILFAVFDYAILEIIAVGFGVIYLLGISLFRAKYLQIEEVNRG